MNLPFIWVFPRETIWLFSCCNSCTTALRSAAVVVLDDMDRASSFVLVSVSLMLAMAESLMVRMEVPLVMFLAYWAVAALCDLR